MRSREKNDKEGLGPSEVARNKKNIKDKVYGQVKWPFGPPHLTLKKQKKKKKTKKHKKYSPKTFQLSVNFFGGCPKFPFFDNFAKNAHLKTL